MSREDMDSIVGRVQLMIYQTKEFVVAEQLINSDSLSDTELLKNLSLVDVRVVSPDEIYIVVIIENVAGQRSEVTI